MSLILNGDALWLSSRSASSRSFEAGFWNRVAVGARRASRLGGCGGVCSWRWQRVWLGAREQRWGGAGGCRRGSWKGLKSSGCDLLSTCRGGCQGSLSWGAGTRQSMASGRAWGGSRSSGPSRFRGCLPPGLNCILAQLCLPSEALALRA